jgi:hypothetical protein
MENLIDVLAYIESFEYIPGKFSRETHITLRLVDDDGDMLKLFREYAGTRMVLTLNVDTESIAERQARLQNNRNK